LYKPIGLITGWWLYKFVVHMLCSES